MLKRFQIVKPISSQLVLWGRVDMVRLEAEIALNTLLRDIRKANAQPRSIRIEVEAEVDMPQQPEEQANNELVVYRSRDDLRHWSEYPCPVCGAEQGLSTYMGPGTQHITCQRGHYFRIANEEDRAFLEGTL